jgi:hypothetical protein
MLLSPHVLVSPRVAPFSACVELIQPPLLLPPRLLPVLPTRLLHDACPFLVVVVIVRILVVAILQQLLVFFVAQLLLLPLMEEGYWILNLPLKLNSFQQLNSL